MAGLDSFAQQQGSPAPNKELASSISDEIERHKAADQDQSVLHSWLSKVWDGGGSKSLDDLQSLKAQAELAQKSGDKTALQKVALEAAQAFQKDEDSLQSRDRYLGYASGALQTVSYALGRGGMRGAFGVVGSVGVNALDSMRSSSSGDEQLVQGAMGATKGLLLREFYQRIGSNSWNPVLQGGVSAATGFVSRVGDYASNQRSYSDGIASGLGNAFVQAADPRAVALDFSTGIIAGGLVRGFDKAIGGGLQQTPIARNFVTGATFGFTGGASAEIVREHDSGDSRFDLGRISEEALTQSAISGFAGLVGMRRNSASTTEQSKPQPERVERVESVPVESTKAPGMVREFTVVAGQKFIVDFLSARSEGRTDKTAALLKVRSLDAKGREQSDVESLLVKHLEDPIDMRRLGGFARTLAFCDPELLEAAMPASTAKSLRRQHVLGPEATGKVRLHANEDASRIAFTEGDSKALEGYTRSAVLGGEQNGYKVQSQLFQWLRPTENIIEGTREPEIIRAAMHRRMEALGLKLAYVEPGSAADRVGMDMVAFRPVAGENPGVTPTYYHPFDPTLNIAAKSGLSDFRRESVLELRTFDQKLPGGGTMLTVTDASKVNAVSVMMKTMRAEPLLEGIKLPSMKGNLSETSVLAEIDRFSADVKEKAQRLADQAKGESSPERRAELKAQSQRLFGLDSDIQKSRTFTDKTIKEQPNQDFDRQLKAAHNSFDSQARMKINSLLRGGNLDFVELKLGADKRSDIFYDKAYSTLNLNVGGQRYRLPNLDARVARLIEQSFSQVNGKSDDRYMRAKRYLVSGDGQKTVRNAALNNMMFSSATPTGLYGLLGEKPPESVQSSTPTAKPSRFQDAKVADSSSRTNNGSEFRSEAGRPILTLPARAARGYPK